jgi:hypothetical protein
MQRYDAYQGQLVTSAEVDQWFDACEAADQAIAGALGLSGLAQNGSVSEKSGTPNLSVDVSGPLVAYDSSGNRIAVGGATTNLSVTLDENSSSTTVVTVGHERYLSLFVKFERALSDARLDALGDTISYNRAESYSFDLAMGASAVIGTASRPALRAGSVLLADIRLANGQTSVLNADIYTDRTQYVFELTGSPKTARARTPEATMQLLEDQINEIITGVITIAATSVTYAGGAAWLDGLTNPATTVEAQLDKIISDLSDVTGTSSSGASRIGFAPEGTIAATNVQAALKELSDEKAGLNTAVNFTSVTTTSAAFTRVVSPLKAQPLTPSGTAEWDYQATGDWIATVGSGDLMYCLDDVLNDGDIITDVTVHGYAAGGGTVTVGVTRYTVTGGLLSMGAAFPTPGAGIFSLSCGTIFSGTVDKTQYTYVFGITSQGAGDTSGAVVVTGTRTKLT